MEKTNGGFLISQIKQIQGRVFERLLLEAGIEEFNGAQGRILFPVEGGRFAHRGTFPADRSC